MPRGAGKYDDVATQAQRTTGATAAIVIIIDGYKGNGFSLVCQAGSPLARAAKVASLLRTMAADIEKEES